MLRFKHLSPERVLLIAQCGITKMLTMGDPLKSHGTVKEEIRYKA